LLAQLCHSIHANGFALRSKSVLKAKKHTHHLNLEAPGDRAVLLLILELTFYRRLNLVYLDVVITPYDLYTGDLPLKVSLLTSDDGADYRRLVPGAITNIPLLQSFLQIAFSAPLTNWR